MTALKILLFMNLITMFMFASRPDDPPSLLPSEKLTSSEKFNERGFYKASSNRVDGNMIVGDYDGNLSYAYSLPNNLPNNLGGEVSVILNSNVEHRIFFDHEYLEPANRSGYSVNTPEWIIGYKGFALQVLNFEANFYAHEKNNPHGFMDLKGQEIPLIIPGYHYTNYHYSRFDRDPEGLSKADVIEILKADGSKLFLRNGTALGPESNYNREGYYFEEGRNANGVAYVQEYNHDEYLREMWYKPGDGLTYYFREENVYYLEYSRGDNYYPYFQTKAMYLEKIINSQADTLQIGYRHLPGQYYAVDDGNPLTNDTICIGRKVVEIVSTSKYSSFQDQPLFIDYQIINGFTDPIYKNRTNYLGGMILETPSGEMKIEIEKLTHAFNPIFHFERESADEHTSYYQISKITDSDNRSDVFRYLSKSKFVQSDLQNSFMSYHIPYFILYEIENDNHKRTTITYEPDTFDENEFVYSTAGNYYRDIRDPNANIMVASTSTYDNNSLVNITEYEYVPLITNIIAVINMPGIVTKVKTIRPNQDSSLPDYIMNTKTFNRYRGSYRLNSMSDFESFTKLMEETVQPFPNNGEKIVTTNYWDIGDYQNHSYLGRFVLDSVKVTEWEAEGISKVKTDRFSYEFTPLNFFIGYSFETKYIQKSKIQNISSSVKKKTEYFNFSPLWQELSGTHITSLNQQEFSDQFYYSLGQKYLEKVYDDKNTSSTSDDLVLSKIEYEYYNHDYSDSLDLIGKIKKVTDRTITGKEKGVEYFYITEGSPDDPATKNYRGFLNRQVYDNQVEVLFDYPEISLWYFDPEQGRYKATITDSIRCKIVKEDSLIVEEWRVKDGGSYNPFKTSLLYNNNNDTLVTFSNYNKTGDLLFEVNYDGYYTEYAYDNLHRLRRVSLPGSFLIDPNIEVYDTTFITKNLFFDTFRTLSVTDGEIMDIAQVIKSYSGGATEGAISGDAKEGETDPDRREDDLIGDSDIYHFYESYIDFEIIKTVRKVFLNVVMDYMDLPDGISNEIFISPITSEYDGSQNYTTLGKKYFNFSEHSAVKVDITDIMNPFISGDNFLYGFKISADPIGEGFGNVRKVFNISNSQLEIQGDIFIYDTLAVKSSVIIDYKDEDNKVEFKTRRTHKNYDFRLDKFGEVYDVFDRKINSYRYDATDVAHDIFNVDFNYLGKENWTEDALGKKTFFINDYRGRIVETRFLENESSADRLRNEYKLYFSIDSVYNYISNFDELGNYTNSYFDTLGNKVTEFSFITSSQYKVTKFSYNKYNRLVKVVDPENIITQYKYDVVGNLIEKYSPDAGTTQMKYDKYGRVRLQRTLNETPATYIFQNYDQLGRVVSKGLFQPGADLFNSFDPDHTYDAPYGSWPSFEDAETDTSKLLVVNMYDKVNTGFSVFKNCSLPVLIMKNLKGKLVATAFRDKSGDPWNFKIYSYDYMGRIKQFWIKTSEGQNTYSIEYEYDIQDRIVKKHVNSGLPITYWYDYDEWGRLTSVWSSMHNNKTTAIKDIGYQYNELDLVTKVTLLNAGFEDIINYSYTDRGFLENIKSQHLVNDLINTRYNQTNQYLANGNISGQTISNKGNTGWQDLSVTYTYDKINQITNADFTNNLYDENYSYKKNGNITRMFKEGINTYYTYLSSTNKLNRISVNSTNYYYAYDIKGNVTHDDFRATSLNDYSVHNLPLNITKSGSTTRYIHDETGQRIAKLQNGKREYYLREPDGNEIGVFGYDDALVKFYNLSASGNFGRIEVDTTHQHVIDPLGEPVTNVLRNDTRYYYIKDHLGSVRLTIDEDGNTVSAQDYSPFGRIIRSYNAGEDNDYYKFTEKERDKETGYDYFGARYYDSGIGRWLSVDPLAGKYPGWSSYNYVMNSPLYANDPDGRSGTIVVGGVYISVESAIAGAGALAVFTCSVLAGKSIGEAAADSREEFVKSISEATETAGQIISSTAENYKTPEQYFGERISKLFSEDGQNTGEEGNYSHIPDPKNAGSGKVFTPNQKNKMKEANQERNNGEYRSDISGTKLVPAKKSKKGVTPPSNEMQVDHIIPRSKGGSNRSSNAQIISREENLKKSNK